jgi:hypothetical protein
MRSGLRRCECSAQPEYHEVGLNAKKNYELQHSCGSARGAVRVQPSLNPTQSAVQRKKYKTLQHACGPGLRAMRVFSQPESHDVGLQRKKMRLQHSCGLALRVFSPA